MGRAGNSGLSDLGRNMKLRKPLSISTSLSCILPELLVRSGLFFFLSCFIVLELFISCFRALNVNEEIGGIGGQEGLTGERKQISFRFLFSHCFVIYYAVNLK